MSSIEKLEAARARGALLLLTASTLCECAHPGVPRSTPTVPARAVVIEVGTVRVTGNRPGTDRPWKTVREGRKAPGFCDVGEKATGMLGVGMLGLCALFKRDEARSVEGHDSYMPDVFVRVKTSGRTPTVYRTSTIPHISEHDFHSRFIVPLDAIERSGLQLQVVNDDGSEQPDDLIGSIVLGRKRLLEIARGAEPVTMMDGGIDKIVMTVTNDTQTNVARTVALDASEGMHQVPELTVDAGQIVEICATGVYKLEFGLWLPPSGFPGKRLEDRRLPGHAADLSSGVALAVIGNPDTSQPFAVAPCAVSVAGTSGPLHIGINDRNPRGDAGTLRFHIRVTDPTLDEWKTRQSRRQALNLLTSLPSGKLKVSATPAGAVILIDGEVPEVGMAKVVAGQHTIWAIWPDGRFLSRMQDVYVRSETEVVVEAPAGPQ